MSSQRRFGTGNWDNTRASYKADKHKDIDIQSNVDERRPINPLAINSFDMKQKQEQKENKIKLFIRFVRRDKQEN